jgi:hypothetical protein
MADQTTTIVTEIETPEAFLAEREKFWASWTRFVFGVAVALVVLLIALAYFLL